MQPDHASRHYTWTGTAETAQDAEQQALTSAATYFGTGYSYAITQSAADHSTDAWGRPGNLDARVTVRATPLPAGQLPSIHNAQVRCGHCGTLAPAHTMTTTFAEGWVCDDTETCHNRPEAGPKP